MHDSCIQNINQISTLDIVYKSQIEFTKFNSANNINIYLIFAIIIKDEVIYLYFIFDR